MPVTPDERPLVVQLRERRTEKRDALKVAIEARETARTERDTVREARDTARSEFEARQATASEEDVAEFRAAEEAFATEERDFAAAESAWKIEYDARRAEIRELTQRVRDQKEMSKRRADAAAEGKGKGGARVQDPLTYRKDNAGQHSYFVDLAHLDPRVQSTLTDSSAAVERIQRHGKEMDVEMPKRAQVRERRAEKQAVKAEREFRSSVGRRGSLESSPFERRVEPNRTDGQGGYFVPPLWLIDEYIPGLRAGRVAAGLCRQMDLPPGTDSINIPKLSTLTQVGVQGSDNAAVDSVDFTDTAVTANVKTLAGQEDISIQLLEQSPGQIIDQVIMTDLMADYNRLVDRQVIYGNAQNAGALNGGSLTGIYPQSNWSGTNTVTFTTPTGTGTPPNGGAVFVQALGAMASQISYNRFDLTNVHFLLHPRRWFWYATSLDANYRPLVESNPFGPWNVDAISEENVPFEGLAGVTPFGPKVYIDANVPTNDNGSGASGGTNDVAIAAKWDDLWLFEGDLRTRVLPEILSGTLSLRYQVYNYVAFLTRYGQSIAIAEGTGLGAPAGAYSTGVLF